MTTLARSITWISMAVALSACGTASPPSPSGQAAPQASAAETAAPLASATTAPAVALDPRIEKWVSDLPKNEPALNGFSAFVGRLDKLANASDRAAMIAKAKPTLDAMSDEEKTVLVGCTSTCALLWDDEGEEHRDVSAMSPEARSLIRRARTFPDDKGVPNFVSIAGQFPNLDSLELFFSDVEPDIADMIWREVLGALGRAPKLRVAWSMGCSPPNHHGGAINFLDKVIASGVSMVSLRTDHCGVGSKRLHDLFSSPHAKTLESLRLLRAGIGADGAEELRRAVLPNLRTLSLAHDRLLPEGGAALAKSGGLGALTELDLTDTFIGKSGALAIATSTAFPNLERLSFAADGLDDDTATTVLGGAIAKRLVKLDLRANALGEKSKKPISDWRAAHPKGELTSGAGATPDPDIEVFAGPATISKAIKLTGSRGLPNEITFARSSPTKNALGVDFPTFFAPGKLSEYEPGRIFLWEDEVEFVIGAPVACKTAAKTPLALKETKKGGFVTFTTSLCDDGKSVALSGWYPENMAAYFKPIAEAMARSLSSK